MTRTPPAWHDDDRSPNYAHLQAPFSGTPFALEAGTLETLCRLTRFRPRGAKILFGLRGCGLVDPAEAGARRDAVRLAEARPDHRTPRCVLGVWDRAAGQVIVWPGSTVPNDDHMRRQAAAPDRRIANMLAPGMHPYVVGPHAPDGRPVEEGAFQLDRTVEVPVWRSFDAAGYDLACRFDICAPEDNIHAAGWPGDGLEFSSAGCQTLPGRHQPPADPTGDYAAFRRAAGLSPTPDLAETGLAFDYLLVTGRHLQLVAEHWAVPGLARLLPGSSGPEVRLLQDALVSQGRIADWGFTAGVFNGFTAKAVYDWQSSRGRTADGVLRPEEAELLGFSLKWPG
ncbi:MULTISPECIES: peptidoglycan-binding domain-containing protein [unclassified Inquilinus]|uniref:peptidoglycan-binding domain-containing protein n=1 Tax=unclassified Inquilinus TaxID=2645927 RepID=UPI003F9161EB